MKGITSIKSGASGSVKLSYTLPGLPPTISSLNYTQGDTLGGGQSIVITGTNLSSVTSVTFGGTAATITGTTPTTCTVTLPAHSAGSVSLVVTNTSGSASTSFEFWSPTNASVSAIARWRMDSGVVVSGGLVQTVADMVGAYNQTVTASAPTFNASDASFGGMPSMSPQPASQWAFTGAAGGAIVGPVSLCCISKTASSIGGDSLLSGSTSSPYDLYFLTASGSFQFFSAPGQLTTASGYWGLTLPTVYTDTGTSAAGCTNIYIDNFGTPAATGATTLWGSVNTINLGLSSAGVNNALSRFAEAIVWSGVLSGTDRTKLRNYISQRYAV